MPKKLIAVFMWLSSATLAGAATFDFSCGNIEFAVDFSKSTVSDTVNGTYPVDWQYDGDWVRWNIKDTDEFYGVNIGTGALILDGVVNDAGCRMGDTSALSELPLSDGAYLRRAFIELPEAVRLILQTKLAEYGYYKSDVDGKWGRGTEAAIRNYVSDHKAELKDTDYSSQASARTSLYSAMQNLTIDWRCLDCGEDVNVVSVGSGGDEEVLDILSDYERETAGTIRGCLNIGAINSPELPSSVSARIDAVNGELDPNSISPVWSGGQSSTAEQLYVVLKRGIFSCSSQVSIEEGVNRTYEFMVSIGERDQVDLKISAYAKPKELERRNAVRIAKLDAEKKKADAKRAAELAEEMRKKDAELAAQKAAATLAESEKASVTPEKLEEIKGKCAGNLTVSGVCPLLSDQELMIALVDRGYSCVNDPYKDAAMFLGYKHFCEKANAWVRIEEASVQFSCGSFNTCSYGVREVGELLVNQGLVDRMDLNLAVVNGVAIEEYCGRGSNQEKLCVREDFDLFGQQITVVSLERTLGGAVAPTFD